MAAYKKINSGFLPFIQKEEITSPFTDIQNRAKVDASLKCIMGVERIHVNSINKLLKESGPDGQLVYEPDNGDSRVRFVGKIQTEFSNEGQKIEIETDSYVEVTFYGTGLNHICHINSFNRDLRITVDGGAEGANYFPQNISDVIADRNYKTNQVINLVSGLPLDWHTVKIRYVTGTSFGRFYGFEILNESSQITVKAGKAHGNGYEYEIASDQLLDYNAGFDNVADVDVGTKGGRAIIYIDPIDGTVKKRLTKVDATVQYLSSADHSNEAPYRIVNPREFGRNRGDDLSTLSTSGSDRAFTLDSGTDTLVGNDIRFISYGGHPEGLATTGSSDGWTLTFVGTGLDIEVAKDGTTREVEFFVDGVSTGQVDPSPSGERKVFKVCSGLEYGSHTVELLGITASLSVPLVYNFIVYQPKKPSLPAGAIELADYNVMADFVANSTADIRYISKGVMRKAVWRECVFSGAGWNFPGGIQPSRINGIDLRTGTSTDYMEYTFFGTGFDMRFDTASGQNANLTLSVNGSVDFTSYTTSIYSNASVNSFNDTTGLIDGDTTNGGLVVSDMPLGVYTVRLTQNSTPVILIQSLDIITPIHSPHTTFGSRSIKDCRNFDSAKDVNKTVKQTEIEAAIGSTSILLKSKGVSQVLRVTTGEYNFYFEEPFENLDFSMNGSGALAQTYNILGERNLSMAVIGITNTSATPTDPSFIENIGFTGKLQKDDLEE